MAVAKQVQFTDGSTLWVQFASGTGDAEGDPLILVTDRASETTLALIDAAVGDVDDAAITSDSDGTLTGFLRGLVKWAYERMPASLGQKTKAASFPVTLASNEDTVTVSGTVTANAGSGNFATTVANGANVPLGSTADAAVITDTTGTVSGKLRGLVKWAFERMPASLGQKTKSASLPVTLASDEDTVNTAATATEVHGQNVGGEAIVKEVTLTLDTSAYADGDVLADTQEVANAIRVNNGTGMLHSIVLLDKDDQGEALDIVILKTNVSIGTENSAVSITDANADEIQGIIEIQTGDYVDLVGSQLVTKQGLAICVQADTSATSLWVAAISRGTGTYTASGITLKLGFLQN